MDEQQTIQHEEYAFPYHYLPRVSGNSFHTYRSWSWSLQYVTALELVVEKLKQRQPRTHIDIGCGDGALLSHVHHKMPEMEVIGVDYDERSINLANVMSPGVKYVCRDIIGDPLEETFDSGSMIEVFEHIPPEISDDFLAAARQLLNPGATLLLTVPHANVPLIAKHYRHFTFETLTACVSPHFGIKEMFAFSKKTFANRIARSLARRSIFVESTHVNSLLLKQQVTGRSKTEAGYERIFAELVAV